LFGPVKTHCLASNTKQLPAERPLHTPDWTVNDTIRDDGRMVSEIRRFSSDRQARVVQFGCSEEIVGISYLNGRALPSPVSPPPHVGAGVTVAPVLTESVSRAVPRMPSCTC